MHTLFVSPYVLGGLLLAVLASSGTVYVEYQVAERFQTERDAARAQLKSTTAAATSKDQVIAELERALKQWQEGAQTSAEAIQAAAAQVATLQTELATQRNQLAALVEKDRGLPDCDKYLAIDVATVCAGHAERVRRRAAGDLQGPTR